MTELNDCPFFSFVADQAIDCSNKEQMPLILRYINASNEIQEWFIMYIHCNTGLTGEALSKKIYETLKDIGVSCYRTTKDKDTMVLGQCPSSKKGVCCLFHADHPRGHLHPLCLAKVEF